MQNSEHVCHARNAPIFVDLGNKAMAASKSQSDLNSTMPQRTREELVQMVQTVMNAAGCIVDLDGMLHRLESHFPGVDIGRLIFDPPSGAKLTAEQIVDLALKQD